MTDNQTDGSATVNTDASQTTPAVPPVINEAQSPPAPSQTVKEPWPNSRASGNPAGATVASVGPKIPANEKVDEIVDKSPDTLRFELNGKTYNISDVRNEGDLLCCNVAGPGITDNDFRFVNPPIKVPDGAFAEKIGVDGAKIKVTTFKVDPAAALVQIVKDAVQTVLANNP